MKIQTSCNGFYGDVYKGYRTSHNECLCIFFGRHIILVQVSLAYFSGGKLAVSFREDLCFFSTHPWTNGLEAANRKDQFGGHSPVVLGSP